MRRFLLSTPFRLAVPAFLLFLAISLLSRLLLLVTARHDAGWDLSLAAAFGFGLCFDLAAGLFAALPWLALGAVAPARFLRSRPGRILLAALMTVYAGLLIFIATSEWFFWDEFGARFNFIAVDYLVWTQEVLGNISESYPMVPILGGIALAGAAVSWAMARAGIFAWASKGGASVAQRAAAIAGGLAATGLAGWLVSQPALPGFSNQYNLELAKNGCWSFFAAFREMELDYTKWYRQLPQAEALAVAKNLLVTPDEPAASPDPADLRRAIRHSGPEHRWNVILICMESMSADYMSYAGGPGGVTPALDRLAGESLFFENLRATGTRTVRGMEALTLNLPPTPGQAIIYRPEGVGLATTFQPFLLRGYDCAFFYGGDGRFDFMNRYFGSVGCRVMDAGAWRKSDTTFKTSWGACDEDLFRKTLDEADRADSAGKAFHYFCMTTSNHRPYTFPADRIDTTGLTRRLAAVKYADWAIGDFLRQAATRPWFDKTLFVICADHCASSAGKADLDITKFHIPAMIYNPSLVAPRKFPTLCSQIDVMPTVFGLLNWSHETSGYGHDLLAPSAADRPGRAFVSNYQKIALLREDRLAILKPKRAFSLYDCEVATGTLAPISPDAAPDLLRDTTAYYQSAAWLFDSGKLKLAVRSAATAP